MKEYYLNQCFRVFQTSIKELVTKLVDTVLKWFEMLPTIPITIMSPRGNDIEPILETMIKYPCHER